MTDHCRFADIPLGYCASDLLLGEQSADRLVEAHHALVASRDQVIVDALELAGPDRTGNRVGVPEHFQSQVPFGAALGEA